MNTYPILRPVFEVIERRKNFNGADVEWFGVRFVEVRRVRAASAAHALRLAKDFRIAAPIVGEAM